MASTVEQPEPLVQPESQDEGSGKIQKEPIQIETAESNDVNEKKEEKNESDVVNSNDNEKGENDSKLQSNGDEEEGDEDNEEEEEDDDPLTMEDLQHAVDELDENIEQTINNAATSFWSFASSVSGKVSDAVNQQPGLQDLRKNVSSRLAPLDTMSRDLSSQITALAKNKDASIANITDSMRNVAQSVQRNAEAMNITDSVKNVAQTVQRNAEAMEAAILAKANAGAENPEIPEQSENTVDEEREEITEKSSGLLPLVGVNNVVVNDGLAKVSQISNSLGQTMDGLWSGLWGSEEDTHEKYRRRAVENVPKTRLEKKIYELQANPAVYCQPPEDAAGFEEWGKDFNLDDYADACQELLYTHDSIDKLYVRVVPEVIEENTFWKRYFFAKYKLELEEERRQKLLEKAENAVVADDAEEDGWGDDDDDWGDDSPKEEDATPVQDTTEPESKEEADEKSEEKEQSPVSEVLKEDSKTGSKPKDSKDVMAPSQSTSKADQSQEVDNDWDDDDWE